MDSHTPVDAYEEHRKKVRERVEADERAKRERSVTCHAVLDRDVADGLRGLIADHIGQYSINARALLARADMQLKRALER